MLFSPQLPLPLEPRRALRLDDFVAGPNGAVVAAINDLATQEDQSVFLYGPSGSGKTHLLSAACIRARESGRSAFYLKLSDLDDDAVQSLRGLEQVGLVCLDDLDAVAGNARWEEALFHFINRLRAERRCLLVASRQRLRRLPLELPDLGSRLAWGLRLELLPLDDAAKLQVLEVHAESLGLTLAPELGRYLLSRGPRDMASLLALVSRLQQAAFQDKRLLTVPLLRQLLAER